MRFYWGAVWVAFVAVVLTACRGESDGSAARIDASASPAEATEKWRAKHEEDYRRERISRREYERRKDQLERGSIIY